MLFGDIVSPDLSLVLFALQRQLDLTFGEMEAERASKVDQRVPCDPALPPASELEG